MDGISSYLRQFYWWTRCEHTNRLLLSGGRHLECDCSGVSGEKDVLFREGEVGLQSSRYDAGRKTRVGLWTLEGQERCAGSRSGVD